jgi:succinylarginine dihydrolase
MTILAPEEAREQAAAREYLERVASSGGPVRSVRYLDLRDSMENGGGPACLRQRIVLTDAERAAIRARVFLDESLADDLEAWIGRHYRDRLAVVDLRDPALWRESLAALDELTRILRLGPVYDFQV